MPCSVGLIFPVILGIIRLTEVFPFPKQALVFMCLQYKSLENSVRKGEIARKEQSLLFHNVSCPFRELFTIFVKFEIVICNLFQFGRV